MYGNHGAPAGAAALGSGTLASTGFDTLGYIITAAILLASGTLMLRQRYISQKNRDSEGSGETL